jgi:hypothetical protein
MFNLLQVVEIAAFDGGVMGVGDFQFLHQFISCVLPSFFSDVRSLISDRN